jgi:tight adherence protein C
VTPVWPTPGFVGILHPATGLVLGLAWAVAVATIADGALGRRARRLPGDQLAPGATRSSPAGRASAVVHRAVTRLGAAIRRGLAPVTGRPRPSLDPRLHSDHDQAQRKEGAADRRIGWAALASGLLLLVAPALAAAPVTWAVAAPVLAARRGHARHDAALADQLPDVVDLLALTATAGLPVAAALVAVGRRPGGPLGVGLGRAGAHVRHGGSTAEALAQLAATGAAVRPLVDALVQHDRYGTPLLPALERVGIEARAHRRRRSEEAARRLPVTLLFPLVLTTFPAFVLLTVVPLLAGSLGSLSLTPT